MIGHRFIMLLTVLAGSLGTYPPSTTITAISTADGSRCATLVNLSDAHLQITIASVQERGKAIKGAGNGALTGSAENTSSVYPAHCLIQGKIDLYTGADGKAYATRFELRLPLSWDKRLLFQGGGGLDGVVSPALGKIVVRGSQAQSALERGFAVVSMDGGHEGNGAEFSSDQQARINFAYGAIGQVTATAKRLIAVFYSSEPDKTYFMGCSNGGREAMIAAQRYPTQFDGIVAGDPAFNLGDAAMLSHHGLMTFGRIAPVGGDGLPIPAKAFSLDDMKLVSDAVLNACDGLDAPRTG